MPQRSVVLVEHQFAPAVVEGFSSSLRGTWRFHQLRHPELLFKALAGKRWDLFKMMADDGLMSIREAARRLRREVVGVHEDVLQVLLLAGLLKKSD